jgi:hypothetical protein
MTKPYAKRTLKVMEHFRKHPDASVSEVAGKHGMAMSHAYTLRKKVRDNEPEPWQPPAVVPVPEVSRPIVNPEITMEEDKPAAKKLYVPISAAMVAKKLGIPLEMYVKEMRKVDPTAFEETNDLTPNEETNVDTVLDSRAKDYGKFIEGAEIMQMLKRLVHNYIEDRQTPLAFDQREAIDMIIHKLGRIINGNPDKVDHWVDIAGYAKLVADRLEGNVR